MRKKSLQTSRCSLLSSYKVNTDMFPSFGSACSISLYVSAECVTFSQRNNVRKIYDTCCHVFVFFSTHITSVIAYRTHRSGTRMGKEMSYNPAYLVSIFFPWRKIRARKGKKISRINKFCSPGFTSQFTNYQQLDS